MPFYLEVVPIGSIQYSWYQILSGLSIVVSQTRRIPGQHQNPWRHTHTLIILPGPKAQP